MKATSLFDLKKTLTPQAFSDALTEKGSIYWWPPGNFWVITDYQLAKTLLCSNDVTCDRSPFFISRMPNIDLSLLTDFFDVVSKMMVMMDGKKHQASRRVCYHGFANKHIERMKPQIQATVLSLISTLKERSQFDFAKDYANIIPMQTLADFFNIPELDRKEFVEHAKIMTAFFGGASSYENKDAIQVNQSAKILKDYFQQLYKERKKTPKEDFFSELIQHQSHFQLSEEELISQAIMMWVAGMVTTSDQMANNCFTLLNDFPEFIHDKLRFEDYIPLIEECSRLDPAVTFTFRLAAQDIVVGEHTIKQGQTIFISNHATNRDASLFPDPNRIELSRTAKHLSYGIGAHFCLGAKLSQIEMQFAFFHLFNTLPNLTIHTFERLHYSLSFSGFETLILEN